MPSTTLTQRETYSRSSSQGVYRQVDYHDGNSNRIVEYRHRPRVASSQTDASDTRTPPSAKARYEMLQVTSFSPSLTTPASGVRPPIPTKAPSAMHVTSTSPTQKSKVQPKVVVIQAPSRNRIARDDNKFGLSNASSSMPLPTPRITRLPTPDFDNELEIGGNRPFCSCCADPHIMKYCSTCGKSS